MIRTEVLNQSIDLPTYKPRIVVDNSKNREFKRAKKSATPEIIDSFKELYLFSNREQKHAFLDHQLRSLTREHHSKPFHAETMDVRTLNGVTSLHDPLYADSDLLERCHRAIEAADTTDKKIRYQREADQVERLLSTLEPIVQTNPHAVIEYLLNTDDDKKVISEYEGWHLVTAPEIISLAETIKANIDPAEKLLVGKKQLYIMPQSTVHKGWKSMYLIAQPAFIPSQNRWVVLQEQHMATIPWEKHFEFLNRLTGQKKPFSEAEYESAVMNNLIELDGTFGQLSLQNTFKKLLYTQHKDIFGQFKDTSTNIDSLLKTLPLHIDYLLDIFTLEEQWDSGWNDKKAERLFQAFFNSLSTLMQNEVVSKSTLDSWFKDYKKLYNNPFTRDQALAQRDEFRKTSMQVAPHLGNSVASQIECLVFSAKGIDVKTIGINNLTAAGMKSFSTIQLKELSKEQQKQLSEKLKTEYVRKTLHGQTWYIHINYADQYTEANCYLKDGLLFGMCDVPLMYDDYCLSEAQYLSFIATLESNDDLSDLSKTLLYGAKTSEELALVMWVLSELDNAIKDTVSITELINNDIVKDTASNLIQELVTSVDPLALLKHPSFITEIVRLNGTAIVTNQKLVA